MGRDEDTRIDGQQPTEAGYAQPPTRIGGRSRRRWVIVAVGATMLVAIAVAKPWGSPATTPTGDVALAAPSATPVASVIEPTAASLPSEPVIAEPTWPVAVGEAGRIPAPDPRDPSTTATMAQFAGSWGVAALGSGPRFVRDEPWAEWTAVSPATSRKSPDRILTWPGTGICTNTPVVDERPSVVAITTPVGATPDRPIEGWWADAGHVGSLDGSIRELSASGPPGVAYLERLDGSPWPSGRYEFHVSRGARIIALVVCLAPTG